jgi:hypothetical protein
MYTALSVCASLIAIVTMLALCVAAGFDAQTIHFFVCWTSAPYIGHWILAYWRHQRSGSGFVFAGTALSAGLAVVVYANDILPFVRARSTGDIVMNCGGPLIELGFPLLQWLGVGLLWLACLPYRPKPHWEDWE